MKNGYSGQFAVMYSYDNLDETFELSDDVYFETGEYNYSSLEASIRTPTNKLLALRASITAGQYYDGTIMTFGPAELTMRPSASMKFSLDYQHSQVDVNARDQHYKAHIARLKTDFTFTTKLSLLMFFQYSSDEKFGVNNIRFRYNPKEGNDLYLVYNGEYNSHLDRELPELPRSEANTILLKYTYTFIWGK
jgi:outer membrane cobalamin receptor